MNFENIDSFEVGEGSVIYAFRGVTTGTEILGLVLWISQHRPGRIYLVCGGHGGEDGDNWEGDEVERFRYLDVPVFNAISDAIQFLQLDIVLVSLEFVSNVRMMDEVFTQEDSNIILGFCYSINDFCLQEFLEIQNG